MRLDNQAGAFRRVTSEHRSGSDLGPSRPDVRIPPKLRNEPPLLGAPSYKLVYTLCQKNRCHGSVGIVRRECHTDAVNLPTCEAMLSRLLARSGDPEESVNPVGYDL